MIQGERMIERPATEVVDRLRLAMAGGNFEIESATDTFIRFRHGTYLTQSAPLFRKRGVIRIIPFGQRTSVAYQVEIIGFPKYWMMLFAVLFCWAILPPIFVYRTLCHHPRQLMENLLKGI